MNVPRMQWMVGTLVIVGAITLSPVPASAQDARNEPRATAPDNIPDPLTTRQLALKGQALEAKVNGKAKGKTHQVARGQYVQLAREGEGAIWTVLGEFADIKHNQMPQPNRAVDNTTLFVPDFSQDHFMEMLFNDAPGANSMRNFYIEQSSNRYAVHGDVTDWATVPGNANSNTYDNCSTSGSTSSKVWVFLKESVTAWYSAQIAAGQTPAEINAYLGQFDQWDRYDYDGDGNFDEPDGYVDTFQSVHAGAGQEAGGGVAGPCAIWSHSWYAYYTLQGSAGPAFNRLGGFQIGNSDYWIGKYTIQPENGGVGVFTHEYGHDLGLPDLYDTAGGDNGTGFWTLMSSGSWMGDGTEDIGSKSSHMGAWEKFQLGWLNYEVAYAGQRSEHKLGPMEFNTKQAQGLFVILPKKAIVTNIGAPYAGSYFYYSGAGDKLDNTMDKALTLGAGPTTLSAKVKYDIELDWDYAYLTVNGTPVLTNRSTTINPHGQNDGHGITGSSGGNWVDLTADLSAFAGQAITLGFRYWTDANTGGFGFMVDNVAVTGFPTDGAETDAGWTYDPATGFHVTSGFETKLYNHYYVAEFRTYLGYDRTLKVGPYYFAYQDNPSLLDFVDHFAYQDGLLVNYWDTSQKDNNTSVHPGEGLLLPVDAHYARLLRVDGNRWQSRIQTYDSTFTLAPTDGIPNIHYRSTPSPVPSLPAVQVFDDRTLYYDASNPMGSVKNPNTGTRIRIQSISAQGGFMQVEVRPAQ